MDKSWAKNVGSAGVVEKWDNWVNMCLNSIWGLVEKEVWYCVKDNKTSKCWFFGAIYWLDDKPLLKCQSSKILLLFVRKSYLSLYVMTTGKVTCVLVWTLVWSSNVQTSTEFSLCTLFSCYSPKAGKINLIKHFEIECVRLWKNKNDHSTLKHRVFL